MPIEMQQKLTLLCATPKLHNKMVSNILNNTKNNSNHGLIKKFNILHIIRSYLSNSFIKRTIELYSLNTNQSK
jgi:hypothetical protein